MSRSRRAAGSALLLIAAVVLSGCLDDPDAAKAALPGPAPGDATDDDNVTGPGPDAGNDTAPPTATNGTGDGNATSGNETGNGNETGGNTSVIEWPALADAKIRPGVQVYINNGQCTSNFLFRSAANGTLYLGTAAHCLGGAAIGTPAEIYNIGGSKETDGRVAYSSWAMIGFASNNIAGGPVGESHLHDFALIEIPAEKAGVVHPAVMHFGGPVAMADYDSVALGDRVIVYGNSGLRPGLEPLNQQEGIVLFTGDGNETEPEPYIATSMPFLPVFGDSGSGLMTKDGKALGALNGQAVCSVGGPCWLYASVPYAMGYANAHGWDLELQTNALLDDGLLP